LLAARKRLPCGKKRRVGEIQPASQNSLLNFLICARLVTAAEQLSDDALSSGARKTRNSSDFFNYNCPVELSNKYCIFS